MKRLALITCLILCLSLVSISALSVEVDSASNDEIVLSFAGLNTIDVVFDDISATAETDSLSDTYFVDYELSVEGDEILLISDVSPIFEDYETADLNHIIISGSLDGEDFAKRVSVRSSDSNITFQAPQTQRTLTLYWIIAIVLAIVFLALLYLLLLPAPKKKSKPRRKSSKKKTSKKKAKKKTSKKKSKKKSAKKKKKKR